MRLLSRFSRINILSSVIIFVFASIAFYILIHLILLGQVDSDLRIEQREIELYVKKFNKLPDAMPVKSQRIYYRLANEHSEKRSFSNIVINSSNGDEHFRRLKFGITVNGQWYQAYVEKSLERTENITRSIIMISLVTIIAMLAASFIINRLLLKKLWKPFYSSLSLMRSFHLGQASNVVFKDTNIDEFNDLNNTLQQSIESAEREYRQLKEFTENASHELQTPLAVIRSKMDVLIQDVNLSESQSYLVQSTYDALQRLARLNQSMLLLNKIENRQFTEVAHVNIKELIERKLIYFKELLNVKSIVVFATLETVVKRMNASLADTLLNNLFSNAIRYTPEGGKITIALSSNSMVFSNTADSGSLEKAKLFNRFYKKEQSTESHGLGLSIVKQICLLYALPVVYEFRPGEHCFEISFDAIRQ